MSTDDTKNVTVGKDIKRKVSLKSAKVKEALADSNVQNALKGVVHVDKRCFVKEVYKASMEHHTQKVKAMCGTSFETADVIEFVIEDETHKNFLDPVNAVNKWYQITNYTLGLIANMSGKEFRGYSATGFKLIVHEIEPEVKGAK